MVGSRGETDAPGVRAARRSRHVAWVCSILVALVLAGSAARWAWINWRDDPRRLEQLAQSAWSAGRLDEAESVLSRLARQRPLSVAERLLRVEVARRQGRLDQALAALEGDPPAGPGAALIERTRGLLELERDRLERSEHLLIRAIELDPKLVEARRDLIKVYTILSLRRRSAAQFRELARDTTLSFEDLYLWCLGRRLDIGPAELAAKLERNLVNEPHHRIARLALAEDLRRLGRLPEAEAALAPLPATDPEARAARSRLALDRGRVDVAADLLAAGPPDHPALERLRGRLALGRGDRAAVDHFRAALGADPDDRDTLFGLGQALRLAGRRQEAQPYLQAARDRDHLEWLIENARSSSRREDAQSLRAIGDACRTVRHPAEARAWYRLALALNPLDRDLQKRLFEVDATLAGDSHGGASDRPRD